MRIELNLAKTPFRNRSIFWLGMSAAYLVAFTALVLVVARAAHVGADTAALRLERTKQEATIKDLEGRVHDISDAREHAVFSPTDRVALDDARNLLNQRAFSWSRLFTDLEPNVPKEVRLRSIRITEVAGEGSERVVTLAVEGSGQSFARMADFIGNLDRSGGRFSAEPVENGQADESNEFDFTIRVFYRPTLGTVAEPAAPEARDGDA